MTIDALLHLIIVLAIVGLIFYVLWWAIHKIAPPEPILKILEVVWVVVLTIILISLLLGLLGYAPTNLRLRQ